MRGALLNSKILQRLLAALTPMSTPMAPGKCVLAPMVRTGELPTRLLALKYGADLVWGPETVDKAIIGATRTPNPRAGTIDFIQPTASATSTPKTIFRTHPTLEHNRLIFQLGTATPTLAVAAAQVVAPDVAGIDVNAGCPKHFSIHAGMGAALLKSPDTLVAILTALVRDVGTPYSVPISVKIRLLEPHEETVALVGRLCETGIARVTVHCRTIPMRPRDPAVRTTLAAIAEVCRRCGVEVFANGDVEGRAQARELCERYGVDGCMIARAAETNMSVFREGGPLGWREVAEEFVRTAVRVESHFTNTKFCLGRVIPGKNELYQKMSRSKTHEQICEVLGVAYEPPVGVEGVEKVEEKINSRAVEKAKVGSDTVRAAGGGGVPLKSGKKGALRGVGAATSAATDMAGATAERETQQAMAMV